MEKDLRNRLEEAARKSFEERYPDGIDLYKDAQIDGFIAGAEHGYKEAIALVKEWWWENIDALFGHKITKDEFDNLIADFESDMNKLWEDEK